MGYSENSEGKNRRYPDSRPFRDGWPFHLHNGNTMIIGLDVGGTHTDAVLIGTEGMVRNTKVPTDPANLFETILSALDYLLTDLDVSEVKRLVLSTTLATNIVVQKKLPPVAILVSAGPGIDPEYFRVGENYFVVKGALDHRGRELEPVDEHQIRAIGEQLRGLGVRHVGVVSKFSIRNPAHEMQIAKIMEPYADRVFMGHLFSGELSFPRRIDTTYLNAAVYLIHKEFFEAVQMSLDRKGLSVPIRILKPDGGNMNVETSLDYPAQTILSGPSASVMGAVAHSPEDKCCLILDIGGTTTDMAIIFKGAPVLAPYGIEIATYKTLLRALMTRSIGVGGDSVVRLQEGQLLIGPDRMGQAMAFGGPMPTPTDAVTVLGMVETGDRELAVKGLEPIAAELGRSVEDTAELIFESACSEIMSAAADMVTDLNSRPVYTVNEIYEGLQLQPDHILVLGGPAEQFARKLGEQFDGTVEPVPFCQVANAVGCAVARTICEVTVYADTSRKLLVAHGEEYMREIPASFGLQDVRDTAFELLRKKAIKRGANSEHLKMEIIEESKFNMVRGFSTIGRTIRVRAQVRPGLIHGYDPKTGTLTRDDL